MKELLLAGSLLLAGTVAAIPLGEAIIRLLVEPADYLQVTLVEDPVLGHKVSPGTSGYDEWGFRNDAVPHSANVVVLGDSQTFGVSASRHNSWPVRLQHLTGQSLYSLALGGYGPVQYYHLLKTKALALNPKLIIVGLYLGNDFYDAYVLTHPTDREEITLDHPRKKLFGSVRNWLAHNSVMYRIASYNLGDAMRFLEARSYAHSETVIVNNAEHGIRTALTPLKHLRGMNLQDKAIREGFNLTLDLISKMNALCVERGVNFLVVLIPTKGTVLADYVQENEQTKRVLNNEREAVRIIKEHLTKSDIGYLDVLPALKEAATTKTIYPQNEDDHPNATGYATVAKAIHKKLSIINAF